MTGDNEQIPNENELIETSETGQDIEIVEEEQQQELVEEEQDDITHVDDPKQVFEEIFVELPSDVCKNLSRQERERKQLPHRSLVYGEITFESVGKMFQLLKERFGLLQSYGGVFYDIGSGCGKVTFSAALLHDFNKCYGIEVLDDLYDASLSALKRWNTGIADTLPLQKAETDIGFIHVDASECDEWLDATLVFTNSTCFSDKLMRDLAAKADQLQENTFFVSVTKPLPSSRWKILHEERLSMGWGPATVVVQKKLV